MKILNNIYVKDYEIKIEGSTILVLWQNMNDIKYWLTYTSSTRKKSLLERLNLIKSSGFKTNCSYHALSSIEIIFEDFKREYDLEANFDDLSSNKTAFYKVLYEIYHNFFNVIPFEKYCELIKITNWMEHKDYETLLAGNPYCCN